MAVLARAERWMRRFMTGTPPAPEPVPEPAPPPFQDNYIGEIQAVSARHVDGWIMDIRAPEARVPMQAVIPGRAPKTAAADQFLHGLHAAGAGDGAHGFLIRLDPPLTQAEQAALHIRLPTGATMPRSARLRTSFEPILRVAMDIVDNCNLRCPFCLYDYAHVHATHFMTEETLDSALRLLPLTRDAEFWFSCLHEPTLHPKLTQFIDKVPADLRRKLFYTTNLAKRMKPAYYEWLADSGMDHVNISIESRDPALYERMRKGARHRIFEENRALLLAALAQGKAPPKLRYNVMAYKSNLRELPELVEHLIEEGRAHQVELRYTFDVPHLAPDFRQAEFLDRDEWLWLRDRMARFPAERIQLMLPPEAPATPAMPATPAAPAMPESARPPGFLPDRWLFRMSWDGSVRIFGIGEESRGDEGIERLRLATNVRDIADPAAFIDGLSAQAA